MQRRRTWLATLTTLILIVPVHFTAGFVVMIFGALAELLFRVNVIDELLGGQWFAMLMLAYLPQLLYGGLGGFGAVWVSSKMLPYANYWIVAAMVSIPVVLVTVAIMVYMVTNYGLDLNILAIVLNPAGVIAGLFTSSYVAVSSPRAVKAAAPPHSV
jgi:hypothetical protein